MVSDKHKYPLAFFSHSYDRDDSGINLFFWELLNKFRLCTAVYFPKNQSDPMDISYFEFMMRRCSCFVAVIPHRNDSPPYYCSPYQIFENSLALRAKKPRLIFVEQDLDQNIFGFQPDEICAFRRRKESLEQDKHKFEKKIETLSQRIHTFTSKDVGFKKPVRLLINIAQGTAYGSDIVKRIQNTVCSCGYSYQFKDPTHLQWDFLFIRELEECSVLISEIRPPYIRPDILGLAHGRCIPTIRICYLREDENVEQAAAAMHLSFDESNWVSRDSDEWPVIFSKYQIDEAMQPIIFWKTSKELEEKISEQLSKIKEKRLDLITREEATEYFLRKVGRRQGKVFISNANSQNNFVEKLKFRLTQHQDVVKYFHYKDEDAISIGTPNWLSKITEQIRTSDIFIAVIDSHYGPSKWCMKELEEAMKLYQKGELMLHPYIIEEGGALVESSLLKKLSKMQLGFIEDKENSEKINIIVENVRAFIENPVVLKTSSKVALKSISGLVQIFIAYASKDREQVEQLYQKLQEMGYKPWMDSKDILPGQEWNLSIQEAIQNADFFVVCLSQTAVNERGDFQKQIGWALDLWPEKLKNDTYVLPVLFEECEIPEKLKQFMWIELFHNNGWTNLLEAIRERIKKRS